MRRWLFNLAAAMSLVLCVALVILSVRSYWQADYVNYRGNLNDDGQTYDFYGVSSERSRISMNILRRASTPWMLSRWRLGSEVARDASHLDDEWAWANARVNVGVIWWYRSSGPHGEIFYDLQISDWFLALATFLMPIWAWLTGHRSARGLCPTCGYDLRATPDRCPECGAVPPVPPVPPAE